MAARAPVPEPGWLKSDPSSPPQVVNTNPTISMLEKAVDARASLLDARHEAAFRLFNGFTEGAPGLVVDLYASTLVIHNYAEDPAQGEALVQQASEFLRTKLEWLRAGIVKVRNASSQREKRGRLLFGETPDTRIREHGVRYAVDLLMNRDTSFYLDTRNLRTWLTENMRAKTVLNTFAYTGSLGIAAMAGGAARVVQHDLNRRFLNVAKTSCTLNGFPIRKQDFVTDDFFTLVSKLKRTGEAFDCVILDPPFYSITPRGKVDLLTENARLINKVRPLVRDSGYLVAINNAVYVSGREYKHTLEELSRDGYLEVTELIPVPQDITGDHPGDLPVTDPAPFNHSTKIAILRVKRKQQE